MILAVNRGFFPEGPKIASDKSAFNLFSLRYNLFVGVKEMLVKYYRYCVG